MQSRTFVILRKVLLAVCGGVAGAFVGKFVIAAVGGEPALADVIIGFGIGSTGVLILYSWWTGESSAPQ